MSERYDNPSNISLCVRGVSRGGSSGEGDTLHSSHQHYGFSPFFGALDYDEDSPRRMENTRLENTANAYERYVQWKNPEEVASLATQDVGRDAQGPKPKNAYRHPRLGHIGRPGCAGRCCLSALSRASMGMRAHLQRTLPQVIMATALVFWRPTHPHCCSYFRRQPDSIRGILDHQCA